MPRRNNKRANAIRRKISQQKRGIRRPVINKQFSIVSALMNHLKKINAIDSNQGGDTVMTWLVDCGGAGSFSVGCDEGNNAGFTDGGSVTYGSTSCTTTTDSCNQPA